MLLRKPLFAAAFATLVAAAALSPKAQAADPLLGALIGGGIGAAIGHDVNRHHGAAVGGVLGAVIGSSIAADSHRYYDDRNYYDRGYYDRSYYDRGYYGRGYYAPSYGYAYVAPAPVYYGPTVVYRSYPSYRHQHYRPYRHWDGERRWR